MASGIAQDLKGHARDDRDEDQPPQKSRPPRLELEEAENQEYDDGYADDDEQEARAAAPVLPGALHDIFDVQVKAALDAVDALVLRPVIRENALDILHAGDEEHVAEEDRKAQDGLDEIDEDVGGARLSQKTRDKEREQHKEGDREAHRENHGACHDPFPLSLLFCFFLFRLFGLRLPVLALLVLFHGLVGGPHKRAHADDKRVDEGHHAAKKRDFPDRLPGNDALIRADGERDLAVFLARGDGILPAVPHHDAFDDRLAADS